MREERMYSYAHKEYRDFVHIEYQSFEKRYNEPKLPKIGAFCKNCAKETAKPAYAIWMNGKEAYALQCIKCGSSYPMYKSMYNVRYIGTNTSHGRINPTHGLKTPYQAMDASAKKYHDEAPSRVEDKMCNLLNVSRKEYREMKKGWEEESKEARKRIAREEAERSAKWRDEKIQEQSQSRKELIEKGILKYVKNIGLVNTETGEIIKL